MASDIAERGIQSSAKLAHQLPAIDLAWPRIQELLIERLPKTVADPAELERTLDDARRKGASASIPVF